MNDEKKYNADQVLLVLGNGFDLHCELRTRFTDYFENIFDGITKYICDKDLDSFKGINTWYLLFYYAFCEKSKDLYQFGSPFIEYNKNYPYWMDIESFIKTLLFETSIKEIDYIKINYYKELEQFFTKKRLNTHDNQFSEKYLISYVIFNRRGDEKDFAKFLYKELCEFEDGFAKYIWGEIGKLNYSDYGSIVHMLKKNLVDDILKDVNVDADKVFVLTFNYTNPYYDIKNCEQFDVLNVHGSVQKENSVIIGYDSSDLILQSKDGRILLSKSGQKMEKHLDSKKLPDPSKIKVIMFYGHSLGKQDYTYFHTLFDLYDIYESDVELQFLYSQHGKDQKEVDANRIIYIQSIYALLNNYASRSGIETEFKTLLSRLQLENRLVIRQVD